MKPVFRYSLLRMAWGRKLHELREDILWHHPWLRALKCILSGHDWESTPHIHLSLYGEQAPELRCRHCRKALPYAAPSLLCLLLGHRFRGEECNCSRCSFVDPHRHSLVGCRCSRCKRALPVPEDQHQWSAACGGHCLVCGTTRNVPESRHQWDGCVCVQCHLTRTIEESQHTWNECSCIKCGQSRYIDINMVDRHDWGEWRSIRGVRQLGDTLTASRNCRRCGCRQTNNGHMFSS